MHRMEHQRIKLPDRPLVSTGEIASAMMAAGIEITKGTINRYCRLDQFGRQACRVEGIWLIYRETAFLFAHTWERRPSGRRMQNRAGEQ